MIDVRTYGAKGDGVTDAVTSINAALLVDDIIIRDGRYLISSPIIIPSNRTVYGKNAEVFAKSGTYDNMFINSDFAGGNVNVNIKGLGNFVVNGNALNNNDPQYDFWVQGEAIFTHAGMYHYAKLQLYNVTGFEISGVKNVDRPAFFINIGKCATGVIDDIYFGIKTFCQNQDGIQIRQGCHDITINNLYGLTGDDFISINCLILLQLNPDIAGQSVGDIYNIDIDNIQIGMTVQGGVKFYNDSGNKIHDITIDGIKILSCINGIGWGDHAWAAVQPSKDDTYNITIDDVVVDAASNLPIVFDQACSHVTITNYVNNTGKADYDLTYGDQTDNVLVNGVQVE